jgi:hypothetical protein
MQPVPAEGAVCICDMQQYCCVFCSSNAGASRQPERMKSTSSCSPPDLLRGPHVVCELRCCDGVHCGQGCIPALCNLHRVCIVCNSPGDVHHAVVVGQDLQQQRGQQLHVRPAGGIKTGSTQQTRHYVQSCSQAKTHLYSLALWPAGVASAMQTLLRAAAAETTALHT